MYVATPTVAGVAVYRSALGQYSHDQLPSWAAGPLYLKAEVSYLAYSRTPGDIITHPVGVWNGMRSLNNICGTWQSPYPQKRDAPPDVCTYDNAVSALTSSISSTITSASTPPSSPQSNISTTSISRASKVPIPFSHLRERRYPDLPLHGSRGGRGERIRYWGLGAAGKYIYLSLHAHISEFDFTLWRK